MTKGISTEMQGNRQAANIRKGDRVRLKNIELVAELVAEPGQADEDGFVRLFLTPVPCPDCPDRCQCCFSWLPEQNGKPLSFRVKASSRLPLMGNQARLEELQKEIAQKLSAFHGQSKDSSDQPQLDSHEERENG